MHPIVAEVFPLLLIKSKEIFGVALVVSLHGVLQLFRREPVTLYDLVIFVSEVKIADNIVDVGITVNRALAACQNKGFCQVFGADMMAHRENQVPVFADTECSAVGKEPDSVPHGTLSSGVDQEAAQSDF
jgi:hypothetical protein